jgi:predicted Zn-dependent protease with MMP-like domain
VYIEAMSLLTKKLYREVHQKIREHIRECIICFEEFKPDHSIIELKCNERNFFHPHA